MSKQTQTRLKILRENKFSSQVELASTLGISQGEVSQIERNLITPREEVQTKLEEVFGLPYSTLRQEIDLISLAMQPQIQQQEG